MWIYQLHALAVCWAAEGHGIILKRPAQIAVEAAAIAVAPKAVGTSHAHWAAVARYVGCKGTAMQHQAKSQDPTKIEEDEQGNLVFPFREIVVQEAKRRRLDVGEEGSYLPGTRRLGTLDPNDGILPHTLQSWWEVFGQRLRLLWLVVLFGRSLGRCYEFGGLVRKSACGFVVAIDGRRGTLVVMDAIVGLHVWEGGQLVAGSRWRRQVEGGWRGDAPGLPGWWLSIGMGGEE